MVPDRGNLTSNSIILLQDEETEADQQMAEKEMNEALEKEAEVQRLKEEFVELKKKTQEMQLQILKYSPYKDFMERVLKLTKVLQNVWHTEKHCKEPWTEPMLFHLFIEILTNAQTKLHTETFISTFTLKSHVETAYM